MSHRHICVIPKFATCSAMLVRYPGDKNKHRKSFLIASLQILYDMKSIAAGPLREATDCDHCHLTWMSSEW